MNKELLMLYGARYAILKLMEKGSCCFAHRLEDGKYQMVEYADVCNYLTEQIEKYKGESEDAE